MHGDSCSKVRFRKRSNSIIITRMSILKCYFFYFFNKKFVCDLILQLIWFLFFGMLIPGTTKDNIISEAILKSSPKSVRMSKNIIKQFFNLLRLLHIHLYSDYSVMTLYKSLCSFVLPFLSFAFMDFVILVLFVLTGACGWLHRLRKQLGYKWSSPELLSSV